MRVERKESENDLISVPGFGRIAIVSGISIVIGISVAVRISIFVSMSVVVVSLAFANIVSGTGSRVWLFALFPTKAGLRKSIS